MKLNKALKAKELDLRLRDKLLAEGKITQAEVEKYLSSLPDDSANVQIAGESSSTKPEAESTPSATDDNQPL